jgi:hypothetical protein
LIEYASPIQEVEQIIKKAETDEIKMKFERQRQEAEFVAKKEKEEKTRRMTKLKEE